METALVTPSFKIKGFLRESDLPKIVEAQDTIHTYWHHRHSSILEFRSSVKRILVANIGILRAMKERAAMQEEINTIKETLGEEVLEDLIFVDIK